MNSKVMEIINNWNPADIYPLLKDEYSSESKKIVEMLEKPATVDELAKFIFTLFTDYFGKEFNKSIVECRLVAETIIKQK